MKACVLGTAVVLALALASTTSATNAKVYVFVAPQGADGFQTTPQRLTDSATDLMWEIHRARGVAFTKQQDKADLVVQVTGREEVQGEYRVHVHVTARDGHQADLTGASAHQWQQSAGDIAQQLSTWAKAHQAELHAAK